MWLLAAGSYWTFGSCLVFRSFFFPSEAVFTRLQTATSFLSRTHSLNFVWTTGTFFWLLAFKFQTLGLHDQEVTACLCALQIQRCVSRNPLYHCPFPHDRKTRFSLLFFSLL
jgi:hypothetical protein